MIPIIYFRQSALRQIIAAANNSGANETGGMLLGQVHCPANGRVMVVEQSKGPGPNARLEPHGFRPDIDYYIRLRAANPQLQYLGEWHKHPVAKAGWSRQDLDQARDILANESVEELLCPICFTEIDGHGKTQLHCQCFYISRDFDSFCPVSYQVIADARQSAAPLRQAIIQSRLVRSFLASRRPYRIINADCYYSAGVVHLYTRPLLANAQAILINSKRCSQVQLPGDVELAIAITSRRNKPPKLHSYTVNNGAASELATQVVALHTGIFRRNRSLLETTALKNRQVVIIGLGSIGSTAALELTRAGVGKFTLIDPEKVAVENLCRHVCDLADIGITKVDAVARRMRRIVPEVKVLPRAINANADPDKTLQLCRDSDIILVATDTENSKRLANWIGHCRNIPIVYAGLLERAIGGRVWRVRPGQTACYQCYPGPDSLPPTGAVAYSEAQSVRDLSIQPGLGNDIAFITHLAVRYLIDSLTAPESDSTLAPMLFWFNRDHPQWQTAALTLYKVAELPPNRNCRYCSGAGQAVVADQNDNPCSATMPERTNS